MTNENMFLHQLCRVICGVGCSLPVDRLGWTLTKVFYAVDYDSASTNTFMAGTFILSINHLLATACTADTSKKLSKSRGNVLRILKKYDFDKVYSRMRSEGCG